MKQYVISLVLNLFFALTANASTVMQLSEDEIIQRAQHIVFGEVANIYTTIEKNNTPFQYITINIQKVYKTDDEKQLSAGDDVVIRQIGGEVDGVKLDVDALPSFVEGSQVLVNLKQAPSGYFYVVGNAQGLYKKVNENLINDTADGTMFVRKGEKGELSFNKGRVNEIKMNEMETKIDQAQAQEKELEE